jgi:prepilin-type N-terminal cleavage/methylation domain-containing protein
MSRLSKAVHKVYTGRMGEGGFTLIELLVVIGILAALAGVVTLAVTQFAGRGKCEACKTEIHNCQTAVAAWMVDNTGTPPGTCTGYVGSTLLTPCKYCGPWTVSVIGVVSPDCSAITACTGW